MHVAYIAFGTNMGDKRRYIREALKKIKDKGINIIKVSSIYETEPYGVLEQDNFLNGVVQVETDLSPEMLLESLMSIEKELDRVRIKKWGPRTIDLDIIFYEDFIINKENLVVPHKDMENRDFVLKPLCELDENFIHPTLKKSVKKLYEDLQNKKL
ncbi:2-amino-4-hydroxy-6-hydroxymethyldihydropteridine diphosphokinase [Clostridium oceanicum]|uniref:2-amino-4-hydroxy-6-hydroxymethyldihydropteridine diphosphokinase n=1 Tax=Clostridium oceanicum TaxID=1543 RepID=A0ABN1JGD9_9CLOT